MNSEEKDVKLSKWFLFSENWKEQIKEFLVFTVFKDFFLMETKMKTIIIE